MVKLSKRMSAVASMVTKGNRLADIGTDHGYVPISLVENRYIPSAIAMDINQGPLDKAREHIRAQGLSNCIETRLSDGVEALEAWEADTILIAGMGGELIIHILTAGEEVCKKAKELVLQPQSDIDKVRKFLRENGYLIQDEDMILEDGKFYPMMRAVPTDIPGPAQKLKPEIMEVCDLYGPYLLKNGNPTLKKYLVKQHRMLNSILENLENQEKTEAIEERIGQIRQSITYNESAYTILGAIKNAGI